jgi:hypothetical protein
MKRRQRNLFISLCIGSLLLSGCTSGTKTTSGADATDSVVSEQELSVGEDEFSSSESVIRDDDFSGSISEESGSGEVNEKTEDSADGLTDIQRNSINMLNYMTVLTQKINEYSKNQLFLESAYSALVNNVYPNSVDTKTQAQITSLMDTIENYRMISVKRKRLEYIYEQNCAQAMRQAIPNPVGLLSAVSSGSMLKAAASVIYMGIDSASSYSSATSQADQQYVKDGWELDDEEAKELHESTKTALAYMFDMVRTNSLPGDYVLNQSSVENFVTWSEKTNLVSVISWLEENKNTYQEFGPYWLELAEDYYQTGDYKSCLSAIESYESVTTRIFRKDYDYAEALPMAIISAKEIMSEDDYVEIASKYCSFIKSNTDDSDWSLRYFAAQINLDLYAATHDTSYLDEAYNISYNNVNVLVDEQRELNNTYLNKIKKATADKDATKREKSEVKKYNKALKAERKIALPPVSEALYLNCDLLFALAEEKGISDKEQSNIDAILHEDDAQIFLTTALDDKFWFDKNHEDLMADEISIKFDGDSLKIPVTIISDRSEISVNIESSEETTALSDWKIKEVKRPKKSSYTEYSAEFTSAKGKDYKYHDGDMVTVIITPVTESPDETLSFKFVAKAGKKYLFIPDINFERTE